MQLLVTTKQQENVAVISSVLHDKHLLYLMLIGHQVMYFNQWKCLQICKGLHKYKHEKGSSKHKKDLSGHEKGLYISDLDHSKMYRQLITKEFNQSYGTKFMYWPIIDIAKSTGGR